MFIPRRRWALALPVVVFPSPLKQTRVPRTALSPPPEHGLPVLHHRLSRALHHQAAVFCVRR